MKIFVLVTFVLIYVLIVVLPKYKPYITGAAAVVLAAALAIGGFSKWYDFIYAIDFNVVLMLLGIMITVGYFSESGMPNKLADKLVSKMPNALLALVLLAVLSGVISAFIDNVATVLMLAPIGIAVAKKIGVSPVPVIISIAVSSNLQGAATLVGDTTSIMLAGFADMSFLDFFFLDGKPSIFWAVEIGALLTVPALIIIFRKNNKKLEYVSENVQVKSSFSGIMLLVNIALLIAFSFVPDKPPVTNGLICIIIGLICMIYHTLTSPERKDALKSAVKSIDFSTVFFLTFLFVVIDAVERVGIIADISDMFLAVGNKNVFLLYTLIVFASVLFSAFIDNIPYVATMLPVISGLSAGLTGVSPYLLYFGLLCGATLGGNLTPVGASANIVGIGFLNKEGYKVKLKDFLKIGLPFTLLAVLGGYAFCWLVWGM